MLKAAVIGLGQIGLMYDFDELRETPSAHTLAYQLSTAFELVAAVDTRPQQASFLHKLSPQASFYTTVEQLFERHIDVEVVSICTPPAYRLSLIETILQQPSVKLIFCEKPVAVRLEEAYRILKLVNSSGKIFIPNLSRRWNQGVVQMKEAAASGRYGRLLKIHARYTRGIYNTGAHLFDLIRFVAGDITEVQVLDKVWTSSEREDEPTFTFSFSLGNGASGFAEAFNDNNYYMFELDFYFEQGKIEFLLSGDQIRFHRIVAHPLFEGYNSLDVEKEETSVLSDPPLARAVDHLAQVVSSSTRQVCNIEDGIYPLLIADALLRSYRNEGTKEKVGVMHV